MANLRGTMKLGRHFARTSQSVDQLLFILRLWFPCCGGPIGFLDDFRGCVKPDAGYNQSTSSEARRHSA